MKMEEGIKRWATRRKSALVLVQDDGGRGE